MCYQHAEKKKGFAKFLLYHEKFPNCLLDCVNGYRQQYRTVWNWNISGINIVCVHEFEAKMLKNSIFTNTSSFGCVAVCVTVLCQQSHVFLTWHYVLLGLLGPENKGFTVLRSAWKYQPSHTASHPKRLESSKTRFWISNFELYLFSWIYARSVITMWGVLHLLFPKWCCATNRKVAVRFQLVSVDFLLT